MFEYINGELTGLALIFGLVYLNTKSKDYLFLFGILLIINMYYFFDNKESVKHNIIFFEQGDSLKCTSADSKYKVSLKNGYRYETGYFIKDSMLIHPIDCQKLSGE